MEQKEFCIIVGHLVEAEYSMYWSREAYQDEKDAHGEDVASRWMDFVRDRAIYHSMQELLLKLTGHKFTVMEENLFMDGKAVSDVEAYKLCGYEPAL